MSAEIARWWCPRRRAVPRELRCRQSAPGLPRHLVEVVATRGSFSTINSHEGRRTLGWLLLRWLANHLGLRATG